VVSTLKNSYDGVGRITSALYRNSGDTATIIGFEHALYKAGNRRVGKIGSRGACDTQGAPYGTLAVTGEPRGGPIARRSGCARHTCLSRAG